jgi:hypothetical protein
MFFYLVITGLVFLLVGIRALLHPVDAVAIPYSIQANNIDAKNYLRSSAGGVTIAASALLFAGAFLPSLTLAALLLAVVMLGGLIFGRVVSLMIDGMPGIAQWFSGTFEMLGLLGGLYWLRFYLS